MVDKYAHGSIGIQSLQKFIIKCVKCYCLIPLTKFIKGNCVEFAIIAERAFHIMILFLELQRFCFYERM